MNLNRFHEAELVSQNTIAEDTTEVCLKIADEFTFIPGQYVWLLLPMLKYDDKRGNLRAFSIASPPNNEHIISIAFRNSASGYKKTLTEMPNGSKVTLYGPHGFFTLPEDTNTPVVLLAGGIGITPFMSMLKDAKNRKEKRNLTLFYQNTSPGKIAYSEELKTLTTETNLDFRSKIGRFTKQELGVSTTKEHIWYISGPEAMVQEMTQLLLELGTPEQNFFFDEYYGKTSLKNNQIKTLIGGVEELSKFKLAVNSSLEHIIITDIQGKIEYANPSAERITGYSPSEMIGNTPRLWGGLMDKAFYKKLWKTLLEDKKPFIGKVTNRRKNGELYTAMVLINSVVDNQNGIQGFIATEEDITVREEAEQLLAESEERWKYALEGSGNGVWDWDIPKDTIYINNILKHVVGLDASRSTVSEKEWQSMLHPEDADTVVKALFDHLEGKTESYEKEYRMLTQNKEYRWFLGKGKVVKRNPEGKALRMIGTLTDITQMKNNEIYLQIFADLVKYSEDAIYVTDAEDCILHWNQGAEKLYGYNEKEILQKPASLIVPDDIKDERAKIIKRVFQGEKIIGYHTLRKRKDGTLVNVSLTISPIKDSHGIVTSRSTIARDITKEEQIDRMKSEFISLASHQLRTPLTAMKWFLERIDNGEGGSLTDAQKAIIGKTRVSNERMILLVNTLLNVSRIESGRIKVECNNIDLKQLITDCIEEAKVYFREKKQPVTVTATLVNPIVSVDEKLFRHIINNLLTNAMKYSPNESPIAVGMSQTEDTIVITVEDHGYGIPSNQKDQVYKKFFRADNIVLIEPNGTGLGLYVVKEITELLGGTITFTSEENKGTTFTVTLPLKGCEPQKGDISLQDNLN